MIPCPFCNTQLLSPGSGQVTLTCYTCGSQVVRRQRDVITLWEAKHEIEFRVSAHPRGKQHKLHLFLQQLQQHSLASPVTVALPSGTQEQFLRHYRWIQSCPGIVPGSLRLFFIVKEGVFIRLR